ncbi:hypothetical protein BDV98DRAFT_578057 [Pterulicium gracile]|uniref:Uncharacterized protein n=1 Tax=Pterulicium gracile TaxID=1884261 RepID=A0A5C3Q4X5_9AGAR|nr:hypothetical protein BDV98DRAFT_578057 [Pterula gracilis]
MGRTLIGDWARLPENPEELLAGVAQLLESSLHLLLAFIRNVALVIVTLVLRILLPKRDLRTCLDHRLRIILLLIDKLLQHSGKILENAVFVNSFDTVDSERTSKGWSLPVIFNNHVEWKVE